MAPLPASPDRGRKEAQSVCGLLDGSGIQTSLHIQDESRQILLDLFSGEWRMLHLSGHGVYRRTSRPPTDSPPSPRPPAW
jgi:hypothetical protein